MLRFMFDEQITATRSFFLRSAIVAILNFRNFTPKNYHFFVFFCSPKKENVFFLSWCSIQYTVVSPFIQQFTVCFLSKLDQDLYRSFEYVIRVNYYFFYFFLRQEQGCKQFRGPFSPRLRQMMVVVTGGGWWCSWCVTVQN